MASQAYCPSCGYPNDPKRGACTMCYAMLRSPVGGLACPACGNDNSKSAQFCTNCQAALVEGVVAATAPDVSALAGTAAAAVTAGDEYVGEAGAVDFGEPAAAMAEEVAPPPPPPAAGAADDFAPPPPPDAFDLDEAPLPEAEAPPPPPPPAEVEAPPAPPDAFDLDLDEEMEPAPPAPPAPPAAEPQGTEEAADDLGDWSLDYDDA